MCTHNGNFPQLIGRLYYLVSIVATDELALRGARVSATIDLSIFPLWNIPIPATRGLREFFFQCIYKCGLAHTHCALRLILDFALFMTANKISII